MPAGVKRILIADDQSALVELMRVRLERAGYEVMTAYDGVEVLRQTEQQMPDLYILDVKMPALDGYEVCQRLKHNPASADIPVIMCSGDETEKYRLAGKMGELHASGWLQKPFKSADLLDLVQRTLMRRDT